MILLAWAGAASAVTFVVCAPAQSKGTCDAYTLQDAVQGGATEVRFSPGTHDTGGLILSRPGLVLRSDVESDPAVLSVHAPYTSVLTLAAADQSIENVVFDPPALDGAVARGITVRSNAKRIVLRDVEVRNGESPIAGGGIHISPGGEVSGDDLRMFDNRVTSGNGGHLFVRGDLTASNCLLQGGFAVQGGAIHAGAASEVTLTNCVLADNVAADDGGQINALNGVLVLDGVSMTGGRAERGLGGGLYSIGSDVEVRHGRFAGQFAAIQGADLFLDGADVIRLDDNVHDGALNTVSAVALLDPGFLDARRSWYCGHEAAQGASLTLRGGCSGGCTLQDNVFQGSLATTTGGAFAAAGLAPKSSLAIVRNTWLANQADIAAAAADLDAVVVWRQNLVMNNLSPIGAVGLRRLPSEHDANAWFGNTRFDVDDGKANPGTVSPNDELLETSPALDDAPFVARGCGEPALVQWDDPKNAWLVAAQAGAFSGDADQDGIPESWDCNDDDPTVGPLGEELPADGLDGDCDGLELCYVDLDEDGFATGDQTVLGLLDCSDPGTTTELGDCDDGDATRFPGADEVANDGIDQDCSGADDKDRTDNPVDPAAECADIASTSPWCSLLVGGSCQDGSCASGGGSSATLAVVLLAMGLVRRRRLERSAANR